MYISGKKPEDSDFELEIESESSESASITPDKEDELGTGSSLEERSDISDITERVERGLREPFQKMQGTLEEKLNQEESELPQNDGISIGSQIIFKREASDDERSLRVDEYSQVIAEVLSNADEEEKMSFALFGHWGRGKTYLTDQIETKFKSLKEANREMKNYCVVKFSAWKYRTSPEIWAYLFQQFLDAGKEKQHTLFTFRAAFKKCGPWPFIGALFGLSVSLISWSDRVGLLLWLIQMVGATAVVYIVFLFVKFKNAFVRMRSLYSFSDHSDKLGLQAAIGADLKALLESWIPEKVSFKNYAKRNGFSLCCATGVLLFILSKIYLIFTSKGDLSDFEEFYRIITSHYILIPLTWIIGTLVLGYVIFLLTNSIKTDRILLVVDDLDRCEPMQMLEIIESTMLILDDPIIRKRLQIMMLIDESAFQQALIKKYKYLTENSLKSEHNYDEARIIRENQEKYFLVHLRLPPLSIDEVIQVSQKVALKLCNSEQNGQRESRIDKQPPSKAFVTTSRPLEENEMYELVKAMQVIFITMSGKGDSLGPRSIRSLFFRYQLARLILIKLGEIPDPKELARAVIYSYLEDQNESIPDDSVLKRVVDQVS